VNWSDRGIQIGLVIGGGNIFRGAGLAGAGFDRVTGDHIGMLATVMNSLAMQDALRKHGVDARTLSAFRIDTLCEHYSRDLAVRHLEAGRVVILSGGPGTRSSRPIPPPACARSRSAPMS
jgi:uridylate kinase